MSQAPSFGELVPRSVGIHAMRWQSDVPVGPHCHDYLEIALLAKGSCLHMWQGVEVRLVPGDLFVITPGETHAYRIEGETTIYNCLFYPSGLGEDWAVLQKEPALQHLLVLEPFYREETGKQEILHLEHPERERMERIWRDMVKECETGAPGYALSLKGMLLLLLVEMTRAWSQGHVGGRQMHDARRNLLAEALTHIDGHVTETLTLDQLASRCYLSPGHFRKRFREETGLSPLEYINRRRVAMAQEMLLNSRITVAEVAERVGIPDPTYFARLFRQLTGMSPSGFRGRPK